MVYRLPKNGKMEWFEVKFIHIVLPVRIGKGTPIGGKSTKNRCIQSVYMPIF